MTVTRAVTAILLAASSSAAAAQSSTHPHHLPATPTTAARAAAHSCSTCSSTSPVVSTSVSGIPELVQNRVTGLLVAPGSPVAFCDALRRLLADPPFRERLARNAREKIERHFDCRATIKTLHGLMDDAAAPARPSGMCPSCQSQLAAE